MEHLTALLIGAVFLALGFGAIVLAIYTGYPNEIFTGVCIAVLCYVFGLMILGEL